MGSFAGSPPSSYLFRPTTRDIMKESLMKVASGLVLLLLLPMPALAQTGSISGVITDAETGSPLPGANVIIPALDIGAAADANGYYAIDEVPPGDYTLRVSFVGYQTAEIDVSVAPGEEVEQDITLQPDFAGLEAVVVTGIASQTAQANAAIDVGYIDVADITEENVYTSMADLFYGKVAGVTIQRTSGNIGGGFRFDIRGGGLSGGQPAIYIDGVRVQNEDVAGFGVGGQGLSTLSYLNPDDIKSIEVLKGPSAAALYGTSGSSGVVLITTKSGGGLNEPLSVQYTSTLGYNQQIEPYTEATSPTPEIANSFFRNGLINKQSISIAGNADLVNYYGSYTYRNEEGAIIKNQQTLNSFRANFEAIPTDNLIFSVNTGYSTNEIIRPQNDNNIYGIIGNTTLSLTPFLFVGGDTSAVTEIDNVSRITHFIGSVSVDYSPFENFNLRASIGYDGNELRNTETILFGAPFPTINNGSRGVLRRRNQQYTYDFSARYTYDITDEIQATTVAGFQALDATYRNVFIQKENFSTSLVTNVGAGSQLVQGDENFEDTREAGIFAQQDFSWRNGLFLTLGLRRDFATVLGAETATASIFYPQARLAFRLDQFGLAPEWADLLKLRVAYGATGSLPERLDAIPLLYEATASPYGAGAVLEFIGNPAIEPERVRELTAGIDANLFDRLDIGLTYYIQRSTGAPVDFFEAPSTGLTASAVPINIGESMAQGVEVSASFIAFRAEYNALTLSANYSYGTNEVLDLGGAQPIYGDFDLVVTKEGLPQYSFYAYQTEAEFNEAGEFVGIVPEEINEEGEAVRQFLGRVTPAHTGGLSVNLRFLDDFNFYALAQVAVGQHVWNGTRVFQVLYGADMERNIAAYRLGLAFGDVEDFEDANLGYLAQYEFGGLEPGTAAYREAAQTYASLYAGPIPGFGVSADGNFVEEASYLKLREVSLSYDLADVINTLGGIGGIDNARISLAARNILTLTGYSGVDPEVNYSGARGQTRGLDFLTLAPPQSITATLSFQF